MHLCPKKSLKYFNDSIWLLDSYDIIYNPFENKIMTFHDAYIFFLTNFIDKLKTNVLKFVFNLVKYALKVQVQ